MRWRMKMRSRWISRKRKRKRKNKSHHEFGLSKYSKWMSDEHMERSENDPTTQEKRSRRS
jgi:hypothetical protein